MQSCAKAAHWIRALALFEEMPQRGGLQNLREGNSEMHGEKGSG